MRKFKIGDLVRVLSWEKIKKKSIFIGKEGPNIPRKDDDPDGPTLLFNYKMKPMCGRVREIVSGIIPEEPEGPEFYIMTEEDVDELNHQYIFSESMLELYEPKKEKMLKNKIKGKQDFQEELL